MQFDNKCTMVVFCSFTAFGCHAESPEGKDVFETSDDGITSPEFDLPSGETGEEPDPVLIPSGECLQFPEQYAYGYVHQCEGLVEVSFNAKGHLHEQSFAFGPGVTNPDLWVDPDSYELPLVAACCGPFDYANATFEEKNPYIRNCLADTAQQVCHALPYLLDRAAAEADDFLEEEALKWAAGQVKEREDECLKALWNGGPTQTDPTRLIGNSWSPFDDVTFKLVDAEVWDWTVEGDVNWRTCESFYENDPAVVPTAPFQVPGTVAMGQASLLSGTTMSGAGPGGSVATIVPSTSGSSLTLAYLADGSLQVSGLLLEASATTVEVFGVEGQLERSSVTLAEPLAPRAAGGEYTVGIGDGKFVVTAVFEGGSRTIDFTNADPIVFRQTTAGQWEFDSFDLTYTEAGFGTWTLSFDGLLFQPNT